MPDYLVDGVLQRHFIYTLTGKTGDAKTAVALLIAQLVGAQGKHSLGRHRVEHGRVIYLVGENADDVRMRLVGIAYSRQQNGEEPDGDDVWFIAGVFKIDDMIRAITDDCTRHGDVSLIIVDTSAAYFPGDDEIDNTEIGNYARDLRRLTNVPGGPCVLVLCHPIKHVSEPSQLLPRGGGAYLAEVDGNLTLWRKTDDTVQLDFTKLRGPEFQPITFLLDKIRDCPRLVDAKGRQLSTVRAVALSRKQEEETETRQATDEDHVLAAMLKDPASTDGSNTGGSNARWAEQIGWLDEKGDPYKKRVERVITRLELSKPKLVRKERRSWVLTEEGKTAARQAAMRFEHAAERTRQSDMF
jgi:hypothetical protein